MTHTIVHRQGPLPPWRVFAFYGLPMSDNFLPQQTITHNFTFRPITFISKRRLNISCKSSAKRCSPILAQPKRHYDLFILTWSPRANQEKSAYAKVAKRKITTNKISLIITFSSCHRDEIGAATAVLPRLTATDGTTFVYAFIGIIMPGIIMPGIIMSDIITPDIITPDIVIPKHEHS